jgi:hypothetical protein
MTGTDFQEDPISPIVATPPGSVPYASAPVPDPTVLGRVVPVPALPHVAARSAASPRQESTSSSAPSPAIGNAPALVSSHISVPFALLQIWSWLQHLLLQSLLRLQNLH